MKMFSLEAEQIVLGCLIIDPNLFSDISEVLRPDDIYSEKHVSIYARIADLNLKGIVADSTALAMSYFEVGDSDTGQYVIELNNNTVSTANWRVYCKVISERAQARRIYNAGIAITEVANDPETALESKIDALNNIVDGVIDVGVEEVEDYQSILKSVVSDIDAKHRGVYPKGLMIGYKDIDARHEGWQPSDLVILAGRPGSGKSAMAFNIAAHVAKTEHVVIFTMEMSKKQVLNRILSNLGSLESRKIRSGQLEDDEWHKLSTGVTIMKELKLTVVDIAAIDVNHATNIVRKIARKNKIGLIVIDYLQLMTNKQEKGGRFEEVSSISRALKVMAKRFAPVLALSQLSRKVEERGDKRPMLSDLRESGQLEQDADIIMMLYRDDYYNENSSFKGTIEVNTAKFREGEGGTDMLAHQLHYARFVDIDPQKMQYIMEDRQRMEEEAKTRKSGGFR